MKLLIGEFVTLASENMKENLKCAPEKLNSDENCLEKDGCQQHDETDHVFGTFMVGKEDTMFTRIALLAGFRTLFFCRYHVEQRCKVDFHLMELISK